MDRVLSAPPANPAVMATTRTVHTEIREARVGLVQFVCGQRARPFRRRLVSPLTLTVSGICGFRKIWPHSFRKFWPV